MKRTRCCENLALRLARREVASAPPGAVVSQLSPWCLPPPPPPPLVDANGSHPFYSQNHLSIAGAAVPALL